MKRPLTSFSLHLLAMAFMLCDHLWATVIPGNDWLNCVGRLAFPIFAFLIAEGYAHTGNYKGYLRRLLFCAVLTEIPFNLMYGGSVFYPFQQNVLWTFLLALVCIRGLDRILARRKWHWTAIGVPVVCFLGYLAGLLSMVDYGGEGVLMVLVFHLFRGDKWWNKLAQAAGIVYINAEMISGRQLLLPLGSSQIEFSLQAFAILSLIPIFLYNGKQGPHSKAIRLCFYAFYPVHMLLLGLLMIR